jgi:hypothetical protein
MLRAVREDVCELCEDVRELWREAGTIERVLLVVFVPLYSVAYVLARIFCD